MFYLAIIVLLVIFAGLLPLGISFIHRGAALIIVYMSFIFLFFIQFFIPDIIHHYFGTKLFLPKTSIDKASYNKTTGADGV